MWFWWSLWTVSSQRNLRGHHCEDTAVVLGNVAASSLSQWKPGRPLFLTYSLCRSFTEMLVVQDKWRCGVTGRWWGCCVISSWWDAPPRQGGCPAWSGRSPRPPLPCAGRSAGTRTSCAAWGSPWRRSPPTVWSPCRSSPSCRRGEGIRGERWQTTIAVHKSSASVTQPNVTPRPSGNMLEHVVIP